MANVKMLFVVMVSDRKAEVELSVVKSYYSYFITKVVNCHCLHWWFDIRASLLLTGHFFCQFNTVLEINGHSNLEKQSNHQQRWYTLPGSCTNLSCIHLHWWRAWINNDSGFCVCVCVFFVCFIVFYWALDHLIHGKNTFFLKKLQNSAQF